MGLANIMQNEQWNEEAAPESGANQNFAAKEGAAPFTAQQLSDPISAALKKIHDSVADEPLPDDFLDLLDQIDRKISAADGEA